MQVTTYHGPFSNGLTFTPFSNADISCDLAILTVTAKGDTSLDIADTSWTKVAEVKTQSGNLQGRTTWATTASFSKDAPGTSETVEVDSTLSTVFSAILHRV